jgi:hypothetical protein
VCGALLVASWGGEAAAGELADTARFLAGKGVAANSKLADHARTQAYADYAAQVAADWNQFEQPNLERMRDWWPGHGPTKPATVFYPFSGPDIANALAFFPDADTYILFGLEASGDVPNIASMDDDAIAAGLTQLETSLGTVMQVNYFFTKAMEKKLGKGPFNTITGLLLFFLATTDCEVTALRKITVAHVPGVEITFARAGGKLQTIRYFSVNVADASLAKTTPDFLPYLKRQGRFATMIKAASYLMHKEGIEDATHFDHIRALILAQSDFVVQDDSGVPLRLFARDTWTLRFHGSYDAPTPEFGKFLQKDLRVEIQRNSTGKLPFSYGYAYKRGESNLVTAERAP